jgi:hypothetical protein
LNFAGTSAATALSAVALGAGLFEPPLLPLLLLPLLPHAPTASAVASSAAAARQSS